MNRFLNDVYVQLARCLMYVIHRNTQEIFPRSPLHFSMIRSVAVA